MSKTIQNGLLESINFVVQKIIHNEIDNSTCFSDQVDKTTDISCRSQLSVIFRYFNKNKIIEPFMEIFNVSSGRAANNLSY